MPPDMHGSIDWILVSALTDECIADQQKILVWIPMFEHAGPCTVVMKVSKHHWTDPNTGDAVNIRQATHFAYINPPNKTPGQSAK